METNSLALWLISGMAAAAPGDHIRAGSLEIVPDVDVGAEFRSNVYRQEDGGPGAGNLFLSPGIRAGADGNDHEFLAGFDWKLRKFLFVGQGEDGSTVDDAARRLDRFNEYAGTASAKLFKRSAIGFGLNETVAFQNWTADAPFADLPYSSHFRNALRAGLRLDPASALHFDVGGLWTLDTYFVPAVGERDEPVNRRNTYGPRLEGRWAFLPRTSFVVRSSYVFNQWENNRLVSDPDAPESDVGIPNSQQVKVLGGMDGQFTQKLFLRVLLGYGSGDYDADTVEGTVAGRDELSSSVSGSRRFLVTTQFRYDIRPTTKERAGTRVAVGYVRDFNDSFFTNYVALDQWYASFDGRIGPLLPTVRYELRQERYVGALTRDDVVHRVSADVAYKIQNYATVSVGGWFHRRGSTEATVEYDDLNVHVFGTFRY